MENGKKGRTILIYTADHDLAKSLTLLLEDRYRVHSTSNLKKGIEAVERADVDLLICDLGLSLEEGLAAFERLKAKDSEIPIIVFCPYQIRYSAMEAKIRERVNYCFHKPVNIEEVTQKIAELLVHRRKVLI
jgi:DNA-binding NtrC family response regulator